MRGKVLKIISATVLLIFMVSSVVLATNGSKTIKVLYQNIKIKINGQFANTSHEPFMINGTTFVPLRFVSEAMGAKVGWDSATHTISITTNTADKQEIARLQAELADKERQIQYLQSMVNQYLYDNDSDEDEIDLKDLEDELQDDYDELENVEIDDIKLDGDEDEVDVKIEVDLDRSNEDEWAELSDRDIEDWIEDLVDDIQKELDDETEVQGEIINTDNDDETLVEFEKDGDDDLEIDFEDEDYRSNEDAVNDVEDDLEGMVYDIENYEFEIGKVDYDIDDDEVDVHLSAEDSGLDAAEWDDVDMDDVEDDVIDLCEDVVEEFEDEAGVEPEIVNVYIWTYDEQTELDDFEYDVEDGDLY